VQFICHRADKNKNPPGIKPEDIHFTHIFYVLTGYILHFKQHFVIVRVVHDEQGAYDYGDDNACDYCDVDNSYDGSARDFDACDNGDKDDYGISKVGDQQML
jgi:hypothetical protein